MEDAAPPELKNTSMRIVSTNMPLLTEFTATGALSARVFEV
jgi:hypothetical protein